MKGHSWCDMVLSVCITAYNLEKYIGQAIESVLGQDFEQEYEILVGDDGSQDNTVEIVRNLEKQYPDKIKLFIMPRDCNAKYDPVERASLNRVNLMKHARGKYIAFLDGDDFYTDSEKFRKQIAILEDPNNADCAMCAHNMNFFYEEEKREVPMVELELGRQKIDARWYVRRNFYIHAEAFVFRNYFLQNELQEINDKCFDDTMIVFYFLKYGDVYYLPDIMADYRQNPTPWKEKEQLEKCTLCVMSYSIARNYNANMRIEIFMSYYPTFKYIFLHRKELNDKKYEKYLEQAKENNSKDVVCLLNYPNGNTLQKINAFLLIFYMSIVWIVQRNIEKIMWVYKGIVKHAKIFLRRR